LETAGQLPQELLGQRGLGHRRPDHRRDAVSHAARMSKLSLSLIIFLLITMAGFQWIFERNEPRFLTPTITAVAPHLPSTINDTGRQSGGSS
jgi:hypothetical protein